MQQPSSGLCVTPRDSFLTDPFFLAARQTLERCLHEIYQKHKDLAPSQLSASPVIVNGPVALLCCGCPRDPIVSRLGSWAPAVLIPCVSCQQCCTPQVQAPMTLQQVQLIAEQQAAQLAQQQAAQLAQQQAAQLAQQQAAQLAQQQAAQLAQQQAEQLAQQQAENLMRQLAQNYAQQLMPQRSNNPGEMALPPAQLTLFNNNFELLLDVHGFLPHELNVSVKDDFVEVRAERLETQQAFPALSTGQSSKGFLRRYKLPHSVNGELIQCNISSDAILHISAPWKI